MNRVFQTSSFSLLTNQLFFLFFTGSSESKSCKVVSERCFSASEIAENPEVKCKSGSTLEDFGHLPADKNYCQIQPDQSIGEKTWAECDNSQGQCPPGDNSEYFLPFFDKIFFPVSQRSGIYFYFQQCLEIRGVCLMK